MLTREEAKTKVCPIKLTITPAVSYEMTLCHAEDCPKWRDGEKIYKWCECLLFEVHDCAIKFIGVYNDIGTCLLIEALCNADPEAEKLTGWELSCFEDLTSCTHCNKCSHRYGYCGS